MNNDEEQFNKEDLLNLKNNIVKGIINSAEDSSYTWTELFNSCVTAVDKEVYDYYLNRMNQWFNEIKEDEFGKRYAISDIRKRYDGDFSKVIDVIEKKRKEYLETGIDPEKAAINPQGRKLK